MSVRVVVGEQSASQLACGLGCFLEIIEVATQVCDTIAFNPRVPLPFLQAHVPVP